MGLNQLGVIGLGVMGSNLSQNLLENGVILSVYDKNIEVVTNFSSKYTADSFESIANFVASLERPRKVIIMVTAGRIVDSVINELVSFLEAGDIIIDGGNSYYLDTINRHKFLEDKEIHFVGMGISGGASGARYGASLMPSGNKKAVQTVLPYLNKIAAKTAHSEPCVDYIGGSGSGHFIKMVHNGIEYADIQIICDAYAIMKHAMGMNHSEIADVFELWNQGRLESYLTNITVNILRTKDDLSQNDLIDMISDKAGSKGTGKWTVQYAIEEGIPCGTLFAAVDVRNVSQIEKRTTKSHSRVDRMMTLEDLEEAVYASKVLAYMQGFSLMEHASHQYRWNLDFTAISKIWSAGCIIQGKLINDIHEILNGKDCTSMMNIDVFHNILMECLPSWQNIVSKSILSFTHIPVISTALLDYIGCMTPNLSTNLLQAMRDYFGGHTYTRTDREGAFHTEWK